MTKTLKTAIIGYGVVGKRRKYGLNLLLIRLLKSIKIELQNYPQKIVFRLEMKGKRSFQQENRGFLRKTGVFSLETHKVKERIVK